MRLSHIGDIIFYTYCAIGLVAIALALKLPKTKTMKGVAVLVVVVAFGYLPVRGIYHYKTKEEPRQKELLARWNETKEIFAEKCRTQAGIKIYRTVSEVEGVLLLKVRPQHKAEQPQDKMWPGAAFAHESTGDSYIKSFLGYEHRTIHKDGSLSSTRGYITNDNRPGALPGYHWVEVIDPESGERYRYTGSFKEVTHTRSIMMGGDGKTQFKTMDFVLDKVPAPDPAPRYGVTYEDHVIPEDRERWIASSTIKVIDLTTQEILGEMTRYSLSKGGISPWLRQEVCPVPDSPSNHPTRKFVDQVLNPKKEQ